MSTGFVILFCWLALAVVITLLGSMMGNKAIMGIGGVMLLLMACVAGVS